MDNNNMITITDTETGEVETVGFTVITSKEHLEALFASVLGESND